MFKYTVILLVFILSGCVNRHLGYFEVVPYATVKTNKIDQPLYVQFSSRVADTFSIVEPGFKFSVQDLHRSLLFAAQRTYGDMFSDVKRFMSGDAGFILEIQRLESTWENHEVKKKVGNTYGEFNEIWCTIQYASTLYRNELMVSQAVGSVVVKQDEMQGYHVEDLYKEAVKRAMANMAQTHFDKQ